MLYAILCYHEEDVVWSWSQAGGRGGDGRAGRVVQERLIKAGKLGPSLRLLPTTAATTLRKDAGPAAGDRRPLCRDQGAAARLLRDRRAPTWRRRWRSRGTSPRPIPAAPTKCGRCGCSSRPRRPWPAMTDLAWIDAALTAARPQAIGALLRYFRDLDTGRGGVPGRLPAGAASLAAQGPAARRGAPG